MPPKGEKFICLSQFMFNSGCTLRIIFIFFDSIVCYKACEHVCNVLGKCVIQFPIYGLRVK